jgi:hypothetical protein
MVFKRTWLNKYPMWECGICNEQYLEKSEAEDCENECRKNS